MIERRRAFATLEVITAVTLVSILVLSMVSLSGQSASKAYADGATIWTDKEDYAPGETVTINGAGFLPNSTVWLVIYNPQDETVEWDTTSDASGNFVTQFTLGGYEPYYTVFATDGQNQAETIFTDSINITLVSVASSNSSGTTQTSFTTSENIYAAVVTDDPGSGTVNELDVDIYVVSGVCPANNVAISDVSGGLESRTYTTGDTHVELVWSAPTSAGSYCIVVDADVSGGTLGTFDNGKDAAAAFTIAAPPVGNLTVIKRIINDNGGDALVSDFTLKVNGTNVVNGTENEFSPGFYNVTEESLVPGYATNFTGDCDVFGGITLESGDDKTCTITNDDIAPKLTINKTIINDNGGSATLADFEFFVNGTSVTNGTATDFDAGFYNVTETGPSAYNATFGGDCDEFGGITMAIGEEYTCTITNDDIAPKLTIIKRIVNDNGGSATLADFEFFVNGTQAYNNTATEFAAGFYNVTETGPTGYNTTFSGDCDEFGGITLEFGDYTCEIINDDIAPELLFIKYVINDNGGTVTDFGPFAANATILSNNTETELPLAGIYNVTENIVFGYAATFGDDCAPDGLITIGINETLTCSITNDDIAPKLTINKTIINDNGGSATLADFEFFVNGTSVTNGTATDFDAGFYNVTETGPSAYNATFGGDCDEFGGITMAIGEEYTCTITNDDIAPILIVIKEVINDDGGSAVAANFTMTVNGTDVSPSSFPGEESPGTNVTLDAGNYNVTESGPILYLASFSADCDGFIGIGEVKTCTVTNDDISPFSVTSSSLCEIPDNQFRDIFTPDPSNLSYYKDTATNPGQFYVNVLVTGNEGDPVDIPITLPYPFVTQGANPIQVHDGVTLDSNECYVPSGSVPFDVDGLTETSSSGSYIVVLDDYPVSPVVGTTQLTYHVSGEIPASGLFYITIHLDFGLKGTGPWEKNSSGDALPISPNTYPTIPNGVTFEFGADDFDDQVLTKENVFKRNPGFAGIVSESGDEQPLQNVQLTFYDSKGKKIGTSTTDEDGYYSYYYKYTGKPTTVVIKLLNYGLQVSATMKANGFVLTNFEV